MRFRPAPAWAWGVCLAVFTAIFTVLIRKRIALLYNDNPRESGDAGLAPDAAGGYPIRSPTLFR